MLRRSTPSHHRISDTQNFTAGRQDQIVTESKRRRQIELGRAAVAVADQKNPAAVYSHSRALPLQLLIFLPFKKLFFLCAVVDFSFFSGLPSVISPSVGVRVVVVVVGVELA